MNARDELAEVIKPAAAYDFWPQAAAEFVLAAGYSKPRTITTAEELDALPVETIVRTHGGVPLELWEGDEGKREWRVSGHRPWTDYELAKNLPASVIWEPQP